VRSWAYGIKTNILQVLKVKKKIISICSSHKTSVWLQNELHGQLWRFYVAFCPTVSINILQNNSHIIVSSCVLDYDWLLLFVITRRAISLRKKFLMTWNELTMTNPTWDLVWLVHTNRTGISSFGDLSFHKCSPSSPFLTFKEANISRLTFFIKNKHLNPH